MVQALKGDRDWSINLISFFIFFVKAMDILFCFVNFDYIPMELNGQVHMLVKVSHSA